MTFDELGLDPEVLKAVNEAGYTNPTPIQAEAIPHVLAGRDVLGIAQTGTGKTASFTLPMIHKLARGRARARMPRSLILEPTRELAAQVAENFETYGKYHKLSMALLIGGVSFADQERKLDRGVDVLIATPGRLLDHCGRGKVLLTGVQILVIDEADRMLDMGFIPDIEDICKRIPFTRQTLFFSATMPPEIQRLTETFLQNPVRVEVSPPSSTLSTVTQKIIRCTRDNKIDILRALLKSETINNAIIFCNRKRDVATLEKALTKSGFSAAALHGDLDQHIRTKTLNGFRNGEIMLLVASDVAARGLDIPAVSHVFNFDVPIHAEDYVHRIGRTGRAGREGQTFMLATRADTKYIDAIEKLIGRKIDQETGSGEKADDGAGNTASQPSAQDSETQDGAPRGRRRRGSGKTGKSAKPERENSEETSGSSETAAKAGADAKAKQPDRPAKPRPRGRRQADKSDKSSGGGKSSGSDKSSESDNSGPVGMGDHVPAFMMRPVKLSKDREKQSEDV